MKKRRSSFYQLLISYSVLVLLTLILLLVYFYPTINSLLQDRMHRSMENSVLNAQRMTDTQLNNIFRLSIDISDNERLSSFFMDESHYNKIESIKEIKKHIGANSFIRDVVIDYAGTDWILSRNGIARRDNPYYKLAGGTYKRDNPSSPSMGIRSVDRLEMNHDGLPLSAVLFTLGIPKSKNTLTVIVEKEKLNELLYSTTPDGDRDFALVNHEGGIVFQTMDEGVFPELAGALEGANLMSSQLWERDGCIISLIPSALLPLTYVCISPSEQMEQLTATIRIRTLILILLFALLGFFCAFLLSRWNYSPIHQLIDSFNLDNEEEEMNEFQIIQSKLEGLRSRNDSLSSQYRQTLPASKEFLLHSLIRGDIGSLEEFNRQAERLDFKVGGDSFTLAMIKIVGKTTNREILNSIDPGSYQIEENLSWFIFRAFRKNSLFLFITGRNDDVKSRKMKTLFRELKNDEYYDLYLCHSDAYPNIDETHQHYLKLIETLELQVLRGQKGISGQSVCARNIHNAEYPSQHISLLKTALINKSADSARECFGKIIDALRRPGNNSSFIRTLYFELNYLIQEYNRRNLPFFIASGEGAGRESSDLTLKDMCHILEEQFGQSMDYITGTRDTGNDMIDNIILFIRENYDDQNMSLQMVAEEFGMSSSNLSHLFKKSTQTNFIVYLKHLRMEKAKRLLLKTELTVGEISLRVGIATLPSFNRIFKSTAGMTPSAFRKTR